MYTNCRENEDFKKFQKKLIDKNISMKEFANKISYTRGGIYKVFQYDRKEKIKKFFQNLEKM